MSDIGNKGVLSRNLRALMHRFGKDRAQVCADLGFKYTTFADWYNGNKYPRIDKIEMLANYFGVLKSDLIEDKGGVFSIDEAGEYEAKSNALSSKDKSLLSLFHQMNDAGQSRLLETADDMVSSGKYQDGGNLKKA